jgi:hypothetical protein
MGLFRRKKKDLTMTGHPGKAVIRKEDWSDFDTGDDTTSLADLGIGNRRFLFVLEVTLDDGRPPYTVEGWFKVPAKLGGETGPGVTLPVYADPDDPTNIDINWDRFVAEGGADKFRSHNADDRRAAVHESFPTASRTMMVNGWVAAAKAGAMSADEFEQALQGAVTAGTLDEAEAEAARNSVR